MNLEIQKPLNISCSYDVPQMMDSNFFIDFMENHPEILIKLRECPDVSILEQLKHNSIELAIIPGPINNQTFCAKPLCTEPFCLVINKKHPLAKKDKISFVDLKDQPLAVKDMSNPTSVRQYEDFVHAGIVPHIILESSDSHLIHQIAIDNHAIGMTLLYLANKIKSEDVVIRLFEEQWLTKTLYLTYKKDVLLSHEANIFMLELLKNNSP